MSNLTFDEGLIREHTPTPLEGHTVVVLEQVGGLGEKFHSLLQPGDAPPRRGLIAGLLNQPNVFVAYAVDASKGRLLRFSAPVQMAERAYDFELQFNLWYRVMDPQLLVAGRNSDPLRRVRSKVEEAVTGEMAELPWTSVREWFRVDSEAVLAETLPTLKNFAREYGIAINSLELRAKFPENAVDADKRIHENRERLQLVRERLAATQELRSQQSYLHGEDDPILAMRRKLQEVIAGLTAQEIRDFAGSMDALRTGLSVSRSDDDRVAGSASFSALPPSSPPPEAPPEPSPQSPPLPAEDGDVVYRVWYATNRRPTGTGAKLSYGGRVDEGVNLGSCDVVIPATHRMGELGSPWIRRFLTRTDDRLRLQTITPLEAEEFWSGVRDVATSYRADERHALVFIHGYRVSFKDAALRAAQLGYDLGVKGPVAFFSWPSRATVFGYPADGSAVEASEGDITDFLTQFARNCGADRVHVVAHSMGNRLLLRALQRILAAAESVPAVRFGHLVLAAPDVTRELFLDVADQYRRLAQRTTLYVSDEDNALRVSFRLQGDRVGLAPPVTCAEGIDTIHVGKVDRTMLGHSTFAEARPVLNDIHALLNYNAPPGQRAGLDERKQGNERYWVFRA